MGAQASKQAARRLPREARQHAASEPPRESPSTLNNAANVSESRSEFIEQDGRDPQLHKNLMAIGQVKIEPTVTRMRTSDPMLHILRERQRIEEDEPLSKLNEIPNRASIDVVFSALERRKWLAPGEFNQAETLKQMNADYNIDPSTLQTLYKYYNTMAVLPTITDEPDERHRGIWVDNKDDWKRELQAALKAKEAHRKATNVPPAQQKPKKETIDSGSHSSSQEETEREKRLKDLFDD